MKQPRTFVISDTHFGHVNILTFVPQLRPFANIKEHDDELIRRWNSVVRPQDIIWHLGDLCFGAQNLWKINQLNGRINLVLGNHDNFTLPEYMNHKIHKVFGAKAMDRGNPRLRLILTHIPVHPAQLEHRFHLNIHGHLHEKKMEDKRYINVSCEQLQLTPILLDDLLAKERV